jgi:hypothetical protein
MNPFFNLYLAIYYLFTPIRKPVLLHAHVGQVSLNRRKSTCKTYNTIIDQHFQPFSIIYMMKQLK